MKALSLWQPWASAIVSGAKTIETRSWFTRYRGPLVIHAGKRRIKTELAGMAAQANWCGALGRLSVDEDIWDALPFGAAIAVCDLVDCRATQTFTPAELDCRRRPEGLGHSGYVWTERQLGDFAIGRFGWVLTNVRPLAQPVPWRGAQGFFEIPNEVLLI
jgi:activating signal cointegrator 1